MLGALGLSRMLRTQRIGERCPSVLITCACWVGLAALVSCLIIVTIRRQPRLLKGGAAVLLLFSAAFCAYFEAPVAVERTVAILPYIEVALAFALLVVLRPSQRDLRLLVCIAGAALSLTVILDAQGWFDLGSFGDLGAPPRFRFSIIHPAGLMSSRNYAGEYLALCIPFALVTPRLWPLVLLEACALGFTRCRAAYLGAVLAMIPFVATGFRLRSRWIASAALLAGLLLPIVLPTRLTWRGAHPYAATWARLVELDAGSGRLRVAQHTESVRRMSEEGLLITGFGMGRYQSELRPTHPELAVNPFPSSDLLRSWVDVGIAGPLALAALLGLSITHAFTRVRSNPAGLGGLIALGLCTLADVPLYRPETILLALSLVFAILSDDPVSAPSAA